MQPLYNTPGVYTNELNAFPNSVVEVATAIPAFIGYTQTAAYNGKDLTNQPVRVDSFQDFQTIFGGASLEKFVLTTTSPPTVSPFVVPQALTFSSNKQKYFLSPSGNNGIYYLYNAIRLFYLNGGSTCFIISIGTYDGQPSATKAFEDAIATLVYEQDPTMLLCPDAMRLPQPDYYQVVSQMLAHCGQMKSRVAVLDVYNGAITDPLLLGMDTTPITDFRDAVQEDLNYGIAYFPWVNASVVDNTEVSFMNLDPTSVTLLQTVLNTPLPPSSTLQDLTDAATQAATDEQNALTAIKTATDKAHQTATQSATDSADYATKEALAVANTATPAVVNAAIEAAVTANLSAGAARDAAADVVAATATWNAAVAKAAAAKAALDALTSQIQALMPKAGPAAAASAAAAADANTAATPATPASTPTDSAALATLALNEQKLAQAATLSSNAFAAEAAAFAAISNPLAAVGKSASLVQVPGLPTAPGGPSTAKIDIFAMVTQLQADSVPVLKDSTALEAKRQSIHNSLTNTFPDYALTMQAITDYLNTQPVAPAMAGVYTSIDSSRGVWKAPANVGLNAVVSPTLSLNDITQSGLNVDAVSGKSINAIRSFKGLGVMVWGARTLDGNSEDWKYVNVRRTMIMIEQSVKLAARAYVFEPNTPNTWTTIKSMVESFLFNMWKEGALFGTAPTDAYTVSVGQGITMTTDDVLNGIMRVMVLVALVRPAEFIMLTFEQEMPNAA